MFDIATVLGDLSTQVKIGWTIWFAWGVVLMGWYRHAHVVTPGAPVAPPVRFMPEPVATDDPVDVGPTYYEGPAYGEELTYTDSTGSSTAAQ